MLLLIHMIVLGLATWRVAYMMTEEVGPYKIFQKIRDKVGVGSLDDHPNPHVNLLKGIFECIYCMSVWVGFFFGLMHVLDNVVAFYIGLPFALSTFAIAWDRITNG